MQTTAQGSGSVLVISTIMASADPLGWTITLPCRDPMPTRRATTFLLVATILTACTYWQNVTTPLPELTSGDHPPRLVRVTTVYDEQFELTDPRVHNDTLIGGAMPEDIWTYIALSDITSVAIKKKSVLRTAGAVVLVAGLVTAIVLLCDDPEACTDALQE